MKILVFVVTLALIVGGPAAAQDSPAPRLVFSGANEVGEVWANIGLTVQRLQEDYIPMVVMIVNRDRDAVVIDRDAVRLIGPDGDQLGIKPVPEALRMARGLDLDLVEGDIPPVHRRTRLRFVGNRPQR